MIKNVLSFRIFASMVLAGLVTASTAVVASDFERAQDFFRRGEKAYYLEKYAEALDWYERAAELNNLEATKSLALMYATGKGVERDRIKAGQLYKKILPGLRNAAQGDDISAIRTLAYMCENGLGVPKQERAAVGWYRKAAELGDIVSMKNLSAIYDLGIYVPRNTKLAIRWLKKAAEEGDATCMRDLGYRYEQGEGVTKDRKKAIQWYQTAASFENRLAQKDLRRLGEHQSNAVNLYSASGDKQYRLVRYQSVRIDLDCFKLKDGCVALQAAKRAQAGKIKAPEKTGRSSPIYLMCSTAGGRWTILRDAQRREYFLCRFFDKTMVEAGDLYAAARSVGQ
jgi:tetratricopeptide (TPR) repeat protein